MTRATGALAGVVAAALTFGAVWAPSATAQQPARGTVDVVGQTAWLTPSEPFELVVRAPGAPPDATLDVSVRAAVGSRDEFHEGLAGQPFRREILSVPPEELRELESPGNLISLAIPEGEAALATPGVYPAVVTLRDAGGIALDTVTVHIVRVPEGAGEPLAVAPVLRIDASPSPNPDAPRALTDLDRSALTELAELLSEQTVPMTVIPTPRVLDSLAARAATDDGPLLIRLRQAMAGREVAAAPYSRLDAPAWIAAGLTSELTEQLAAGAAVTAAHLAVEPERATWIASESLSPDAVTQLAALGFGQFLIADPVLSPVDPDLFETTVTKSFEVVDSNGVGHPAVAIDPELQAHVNRTGDPVLDAYTLLADLSVVYFENRGDGGLAFVPPDDAPVPQAFMTTVASELDHSPILDAVTVDELFGTIDVARSGGEDAQVGDALQRAIVAPAPQRLDAYAAALASATTALVSFEGFIGDGPASAETVSADDLRRLLLVSGDQRLAIDDQIAYLAEVDVEVAGQMQEIRPPTSQRFTLAGRSGTIPLQITNALDRPVSVLVSLDSDKLDFPDGSTMTLELDGGSNLVDVRVEAKASGDSTMEVLITSPDRSMVLGESRLTVRSTRLSYIGIVIAAAAGAVLLLWWLQTRRRRKDRQLVVLPGGRIDDE